jgi:DNA-directed RNA polymerase subunit alpha
MQNIALAKKITYKEGEVENEGIVTIEPLFPGYGMTLGNSLRRVLLSSLPGAAVVGVKIKGASHEFMSIPKIKEDVLEMVLNIKQLRVKTHSEEEVKLELKVKGKKKVTAKDIEKNAEVEIMNPELYLAEITEASGELEMEIFVRPGLGYSLAEGTKNKNREIGFIELDSIYSPVTLVSIEVENTRVGKMTNWDKLNLQIKTDGTVNPEDAFYKAVDILVAQFSALTPNSETPVEIEENKKEEKEEDVEEKENKENKEEVKEEKKEKEDKKEKKEKKTKAKK